MHDLSARTAVVSPLRPAYLAGAVLSLCVMVGAIISENAWLQNFIHVMSGLLWTGIDLFMGFVIGPIVRRSALDVRNAVVTALVPRTLILMPVLSIVSSTSGWFLAKQIGFLDVSYPGILWVYGALVIVTILSIQGLGILLPTNLRIYFEIQKPQIDNAKIDRWMRRYVRVVASQGVMQVAIIVVMARFSTGL